MGNFDRYDELASAVGADLAMFYCCMLYDLPYIPSVVGKKTWANFAEYRNHLAKAGIDRYEDEPLGFLDGSTDVRGVLENNIDDHERHVNTWGIGDAVNPYTEQDYQRLDSLFKTYSSRLVSAGGYDMQQEDTLRTVCKYRLMSDKCFSSGTKNGIELAQRLNKMIQEILSSENLRKKDERPVEEVRIDSIVDSLEKAGLVKEGKILPLKELQDALLKRLGTMGGNPSHKYAYTLDAADHMILAVINTMRANDGYSELSELPEEAKIDAAFAAEFAAKPNETEKDSYEKIGILRWGSAAKE